MWLTDHHPYSILNLLNPTWLPLLLTPSHGLWTYWFHQHQLLNRHRFKSSHKLNTTKLSNRTHSLHSTYLSYHITLINSNSPIPSLLPFPILPAIPSSSIWPSLHPAGSNYVPLHHASSGLTKSTSSSTKPHSSHLLNYPIISHHIASHRIR